MADDMRGVLAAARAGFAAQDEEINRASRRQTLSVVAQRATGMGDIAHTFDLGRRYRLVYVRCHFFGNAGTAALAISLDSEAGSAYDATLATVAQAGTDNDVNFTVSALDSAEPSAWTFGADDKTRIDWTNPDTGKITWGLEVGLAVAT